MEERKFLKKKEKALNGSNRKYLAEICIELGDYYEQRDMFEKAIKEYKQAVVTYSELQMKLEYAQTNRKIGEMYLLLGEYEKALKFVNTYLSISQELENKVEEQRSLVTLGRIFLCQGEFQKENCNDFSIAKQTYTSSLKYFVKSLNLCESLKGKINNKEWVDMRARLLFNIGLVSDHLDDIEKALDSIKKAIIICKNHDLYDLLIQCYMHEGRIYSSRINDLSKALGSFNLALDVVSKLKDKNTKQCEILLFKAKTLCKISDFQSAKIALLKAWKLKTPVESDLLEIEQNLKIVAALCYTEDLLITTDSCDYEKLKKLYEKMGDGACSLKNFQKAIYYYLKTLENAEKNGNSEKELIPIYISLYQTYKDLKEYDNAIEYNKKEYELVKNVPKEAISTLLNIAETLHLAGKKFDEIEPVLLNAKNEAKKESNKKLVIKCIKMLITIRKDLGIHDNDKLESELLSLKDLGYTTDDSLEDDSEAVTTHIGEDICLDDLTDLSDNEDQYLASARVVRKRGKRITIKKNCKGETQLHQACISGNNLLATCLISQGHPINVRDNAGWLPIHEACIHGHKSIVDTLIKNGAHINDKGGNQCDGITPLHDAASNGHLEIIELLLDSGASPIIKTDHGDTALDVLIKWRKRTTLDSSEHILYETLCHKMNKKLEKIGSSPQKVDRTANLNDFNSIGSKNNLDDKFEVSVKKNMITSDSEEYSNSPIIKKNNRKILDDNSDSNDIISKSKSINEYRNAINSMRSRSCVATGFCKENKNKEKRSAILSSEDVGDDWLEDDMIQINKKRRKSDESLIFTKNKLTHETMSDIDFSKKNIFSEINIDDESSNDSCEIYPQENISPNILNRNFEKSKTSKLSKIKIRQSSLLKSGFSKNKKSRLKVHSSSFSGRSNIESDSDNSLLSNISLHRINNLCNEEPDSTTEINLSSLFSNKRQGTENMISQFSIQSTPPQISVQSITPHLSTQSLAVKVQIQNKLLLIPISMDKIDTFTISWLNKEACKRYYNIEGVQPIIHLLTNDGALLNDDDPLNLVLNSLELKANIISWNLPPIKDRYIECCKQFNNVMDDYIKEQLDSSQATYTLDLSNLSLISDDVKPVFKALYHQSNLRSIILSGNNIGNDGVKHLSNSLQTLTNLSYLNLSGNCISSDGIQHILDILEKSNKTICQYLEHLDLSFNPLHNTGFMLIIKITMYIHLKQLNLKACDISCNSIANINELNLQMIEMIDLSNNIFSKNTLLDLFGKVNLNNLITLKLEKIDLSDELTYQIFSLHSYYSLSQINLSRCNLTDNDISCLLRSLTECNNLRKLCISYNKELTFLSLKKILQYPNLSHIDLSGCINILKYLEFSDISLNLFTDSDVKIEELRLSITNVNSDTEKIVDSLSTIWQNYWNYRAAVRRDLYGLVIFNNSH